MRIRSIRPEFWSSEDVAAMTWETRLVFIGLWSYVDDNGVGRDIERLITTALFPLDEDFPESSRRVTGALRHLSGHGQITRFEVDGRRYLHVSAWSNNQRIEKASKGRYPLPTCENAEVVPDSPTTPVALPDMSVPGEGEKGRRGEVEKVSRIPSPATPSSAIEFDAFWAIYPKKVGGKVDARKAFVKAVNLAGLDAVMAGVKRYATDPNLGDRQYIPNPSTWLNQGRWDDDPCTPNAGATTTPRTGSSIWDRKPPVRSAS